MRYLRDMYYGDIQSMMGYGSKPLKVVTISPYAFKRIAQEPVRTLQFFEPELKAGILAQRREGSKNWLEVPAGLEGILEAVPNNTTYSGYPRFMYRFTYKDVSVLVYSCSCFALI